MLLLVGYVKAWQHVLNKQSQQPLFDFNTYTLAMMVTVVQQRELRLPTVDEFMKLQKAKQLKQGMLKLDLPKAFNEFVVFFGVKYQKRTRLISPFVPHFLNVQQDITQKTAPPVEQM